MHESNRIAQVNKYVKKRTGVLCYKIQAMMNNGIADCYYAGPCCALWVEYKQVKLPKRDTTVINPNLTPLQLDFLEKHQLFNLDAWVIIFTDKGHFILKNYDHWENGITTAEAKALLRPTYKDIANEILQATHGF